MSESLRTGLASGTVDRLVAEVVAEITDRLHAGERVDVEEYITRHPELAERLRPLLGALEALARFSSSAHPDGSPAGAAGGEEMRGTLGDFRIIREVGRGGMGVVYEAEQISLGRRVALKVLPFAATMDPRQLQRFQNEVRAAAGLYHTNIVPVHGVGCERGVHYYAMQFIEGRTLADVIAQQQGTAQSQVPSADLGEARAAAPSAPTAPVAVQATSAAPRDAGYFRRVADWGIQAGEALDHAHSLGVIHRDVKPANLLVDGTGRLWVTDFGLALVQSDVRLTMTGDLVGTLRYMSPEQALANRVVIDQRTDVYSLGATLYELLALRPVFDGTDRRELLRRIAFEEPVRLRRLNRAIPAELETIVHKALEKNPQDRYVTVKELADDLRRWCEDRPIRARRPPLRARLARWGRRHRSLVAATTAALLVGLVVLAGSLGWVARDRAARRAQNTQIVNAALEEADSWQRRGRLSEALSAARRADGLLNGADVDETLRQRVRERLADLQLVDRLENVRLEYGTGLNNGKFDEGAILVAFEQILREAGLDVMALSPDEAGERIAHSTVTVELSVVLDWWAATSRAVRGKDDPGWKQLLRVVRVADPDPMRTRVREAVHNNDLPAVRALAASEETLRLPPATLDILGSVLLDDNAAPRPVEAFLRAAQRRHPNDFWLNFNLYKFLTTQQPPQWDEAVRFAAVVVALRPDSPGAHGNLGHTLSRKGRLDESLAEFREVVRLKPDDPVAHINLSVGLYHKGSTDEAIAECREAIRLDKDSAHAHYNLGGFLRNMGQLDEAAAEFRAAIRINKDKADAHCDLGHVLQEKGQFAEALVHLRLGHQSGTRDPNWHYPSEQWVQHGERLLELDRKLPEFLSGTQRPADVGECIAVAELCQMPCKKCYVAALRFYQEAFAADRKLIGDRPSDSRYNAACAAALAGCGQGNDGDK